MTPSKAALVAGPVVGGLLVALARQSRHLAAARRELAALRSAAEQARAAATEQARWREQAEAALRNAQRSEVVGQFTGGLAHDFNNLLTVILGSLELLTHGAEVDTSRYRSLGTIRGAAERGASLTAQLLAFARRQPLQPVALDIAASLAGMRDLLGTALGGRIRLVTCTEPTLWHALIDPTQLELMVLNLAVNARDAMPRGGTLTITAGNSTLGPPDQPDGPAAGDYVCLAVADTGTGMTQATLARAFEPFFTTKAVGKGSGLGLPHVRDVVRRSGGDVRIETALDLGTTVRVLLPRASSAEPALRDWPGTLPLDHEKAPATAGR